MAQSGAQIAGVVGGLLGGLAVGFLGFRLTQTPPSTTNREVTYSVRTEPFGATISVDNNVLGTAPMVLLFAPTPEKSKYQLTVSYPGFISTSFTHLAEKNEEATITLTPQ
jgi:hypothetical protein